MALTKFKNHFPNLANKVKSSKKVICGRELEVQLTDGRGYIFDTRDETLHRLPDHKDQMTRLEFQTEFGYRLRKVLIHKGLTQKELGDRADIAQSDVSEYVRGTRVPSFYVVDRIARALDISADELRYI
mgnify:CR=1 FL=1